ncbi:MAG: glycine cleavage system H protein [Cellvibrionaceae bacterium]|jgi:glycine cleavage system H protein
MSEVRSKLQYLSSHEWARLEEDGTVTVGISDYAQDSLGDIIYVELPQVDDEVTAGVEAGVVESVKAASEIYSPVSGKVIAVNKKLTEESEGSEVSPEIVNQSPYDDGWFYKVQPKGTLEAELKNTMDSDAYRAKLNL